MVGKILIVVVILIPLFSITSQLKISSVSPPKFNPSNSLEYSNYVKLIFGLNQITDQYTPQLIQLINQERFSVFNAVDQLIIILSKTVLQEIQSSNNEILPNKDLINIVSNNNVKFIDMINKQPQSIQNKITQLTNDGLCVHNFVGKPQELKELMTRVNIQRYNIRKRMLSAGVVSNQSVTTPSPSYLIKIFFSLLFIIVTFYILISIATMENTKDTLHYAKFIADIGR